MEKTIIIKRSAVSGKIPTSAQLGLGELAINTYDGKIYLKKDDGAESIVSFFGGASQLELITENSNTGWRVFGRDPAVYGIIGDKAIDFSYQDGSVISDGGAVGSYSFAKGNGTKASGSDSHAEGTYTIAQNNSMYAAGKYNIGTSPDSIMEVGIGIDNSTRKNGFEIYTDGKMRAPELTVALHDNPRSLVTKEYAETNFTTITNSNTNFTNIFLLMGA